MLKNKTMKGVYLDEETINRFLKFYDEDFGTNEINEVIKLGLFQLENSKSDPAKIKAEMDIVLKKYSELCAQLYEVGEHNQIIIENNIKKQRLRMQNTYFHGIMRELHNFNKISDKINFLELEIKTSKYPQIIDDLIEIKERLENANR